MDRVENFCRHTNPLLVARRPVKIETKLRPCFQFDLPSEKLPIRSFGPCRSAMTAIGLPVFFKVPDDTQAFSVILMRAMTEIQPENIHPGLKQLFYTLGVELACPRVATIFVFLYLLITPVKR